MAASRSPVLSTLSAPFSPTWRGARTRS
jgi:hypothetical protein